MAQREASIRVTIKQGGFQSGLNTMVARTRIASQQMGAAINQRMRAGMAGVGVQMKNMMSGIGGQIKNIAALGGTVATFKFLKDAVDMQSAYRDIAHDVSKVTEGVTNWQQVQKDIEPIANKTGQRTMEMAEAFKTIFGATGDYEYTKKVLEAVGMTATASGKGAAQWGEMAQLAYRKFGVSAEEVPNLLARIDEQLGVGGASIDDVSGRFGMMATEAAGAGLKGAEGMVQLLSMMRAVDNEVGERAAPALKQLFEYLKANTTQMEALQKKGKLKFTADMNALDKIRETLKTAEGRKAAELTFTGDARRVYDSMVKPFDQAVKRAKEAGKTTAEATKAGLDAFDKALGGAGTKTRTYADIQKEAADRIKDDPTVAMRLAFNKVATSFNNPKMMESISKLAKMLPELADGFVKILEFVVDSPMTAGGMYVGARAGIGFAQGALMNAGASVGASATTTMQAGAPATGTKIGLAARGLIIAAAAYAAYLIGKETIERFSKSKEQTEEAGVTAEARVAGVKGGSVELQRAELKRIQEQIITEKAKAKRVDVKAGEFLTGATDWAARTMGLLDKGDKGRIETRADAIAKLEAAERDLLGSINKKKAAEELAARASGNSATELGKLKLATEDAHKVLQKIGKIGGWMGGGTPGPLPNAPGHDAPGGV